MTFYSESELRSFGFKYLGQNVKVSTKASIYNANQIEIGDNSRIDDFSVISGQVSLGRNVHVAVFSNIAGGDSGILIEDFSGIAYGGNLFAQSDDYSGLSLTNPTIPDIYKSEVKKPIVVERHSIIGANSIVFPGVTLAVGTAIGCMSLVTKNTEPWSIYFGVPAKKIKRRKRDVLELERKFLQQSS